tara:strand:- start:5002 stop:7098 length:2097 start_codon:yes stop_codon:yes gene_type:complete
MTSYRAARLAMLFMFSVIANFSFFSFPVNAANGSFSFIEFNIAFVLGLSLPVLLMVFIVKPTAAIKKRLPVLLTVALLGLLYSLNYHPEDHIHTGIIFSGLMLQVTSYWSSHYHTSDKSLNFKPVLKNIIYVVVFVLFIILLWSTTLASKVSWLIFTCLQLLIAISYIRLVRQKAHQVTARSISLLVINLLFAVATYFWLAGELSLNLLVVVSIITYLLAMANGCWHLVTTLMARENQQKALSVQSSSGTSYDPATNLPNYQHALAFFEHNVKTNLSARYAVIVFKPTNFQQVNGVLGHHNSDILLLQLAYCLQKSLTNHSQLLNFSEPESPVRLARLQGLNFLVVMDLSQKKHNDEALIEHLCRELALAVPGPMSFKSFSSFFKLVFGVAFVGQENNSVSEVIACAEDALLQAEKQDKQVSFFNQELAIFNQQQLLKMEQLKHAINNDSLQWSLQPQVTLNNKRIIGFEMRVAWQRQGNQQLNLAEIMTIAEQSGDAFALSRQMVCQAFKALVELHQINVPVSVAIKLTGDSLLEPDLVDYIEQQSAVYNVDCRFLSVEVQETILLMASPQAKASIDQLKSLGVEIVIDEFSGSYEALRYIRRLAVNGIKINCGVLANAAPGSSDKAIINALITLTRKMDLPLIGTNINDLLTEEMFLAMGGEYAQGQYYGAGISHQVLPHWFTAWQKHYSEQPNSL